MKLWKPSEQHAVCVHVFVGVTRNGINFEFRALYILVSTPICLHSQPIYFKFNNTVDFLCLIIHMYTYVHTHYQEHQWNGCVRFKWIYDFQI